MAVCNTEKLGCSSTNVNGYKNIDIVIRLVNFFDNDILFYSWARYKILCIFI